MTRQEHERVLAVQLAQALETRSVDVDRVRAREPAAELPPDVDREPALARHHLVDAVGRLGGDLALRASAPAPRGPQRPSGSGRSRRSPRRRSAGPCTGCRSACARRARARAPPGASTNSLSSPSAPERSKRARMSLTRRRRGHQHMAAIRLAADDAALGRLARAARVPKGQHVAQHRRAGSAALSREPRDPDRGDQGVAVGRQRLPQPGVLGVYDARIRPGRAGAAQPAVEHLALGRG